MNVNEVAGILKLLCLRRLVKVFNDIDVLFTDAMIYLWWEDGYINRKEYFEC